MRLSLKELMLVVTFVAFGCAALRFASGGMLLAMQAVAGVLLLGIFVAAIVDRGPRQAFAIGFTVGALFFSAVAWLDGGERAGVWSGAFGTTQALAALHSAILEQQWIDDATKEVVPAADVNAPPGSTRITRMVPITPPTAEDGSKTENGAATSPALAAAEIDQMLQELEAQRNAVAEYGAVLRARAAGSTVVRGGGRGGASGRGGAALGGGGRGGGATIVRGGRGGAGGSGTVSGARGLSNQTLRTQELVVREQVNQRIAQIEQLQAELRRQRDQILQEPQSVRLVGQQQLEQQMERLRRQVAEYQSMAGLLRPAAAPTRRVTYVRQDVPAIDPFRNVGACLWMLMFGYAGGQFARYVYVRRERP